MAYYSFYSYQSNKCSLGEHKHWKKQTNKQNPSYSPKPFELYCTTDNTNTDWFRVIQTHLGSL